MRVSTAFGMSSMPRCCSSPLAGCARFVELTAAFAICLHL
jgi:hypothetical protein